MRRAVMRALSTTINTAAVLLCMYLASPFVGAFLINSAIKANDTARMNALIDWDSVRNSLRRSIMVRLGEKAAARPANPGFFTSVKYELTDALSPMMVEQMLAERVSPSGFATYMGPNSPKAQAARAQGLDPDTMPNANVLKRIGHAYFRDLSHFEIELSDRWDEGKVYRTVLELRDLVWHQQSVEMVSLGQGA